MPDTASLTRTTTGTCFVPGHFGEFLQGRIGPEGPVALVTLPCPRAGVEVTWSPCGPFRLNNPDRAPVIRAAHVEALSRGPAQGTWTFRSRFPAGSGTGASTAALIATARLLACDEADLARRLVALEGATDPLMLKHPTTHLWASREARTVARLPKAPIFQAVGGLWGAPHVTDPADEQFPDISDLIAPWRAACKAGDLAQAGALAQISASRSTALRGGSDLTALEHIRRETGALGIARAHTGCAICLLFAPGRADHGDVENALRALGLRQVTGFLTEDTQTP